MKRLYQHFYIWACWASVEEACAPDGELPWYRKLARRVLPHPSREDDSDANV